MIDVKRKVISYSKFGEDMSVNATVETENLYAQYNWFANSYPPAIQKASDEFFLPGLQFVLVGISKNVNSLADKDAYFVTKVRIDKLHDMFFRLSERAIEIILERALGKAETKFNLNKLTDLEAKIITAFNDYMYNSISQYLSPIQPTLKRTNFDVIYLSFILKDLEKNTTAKFIVTLPEELLKPDIIKSNGEKFNERDFATSLIDVTIKIGTTRVKLIDVKNIDIDDIVVLDDSQTDSLILNFRDFEKNINLKPNLGLVMPYDNDGGDRNMTDNANLWDSIEVEMNAQFDTVRITLGELKNIEEGLVVDLTSIYNNKVTLSVEDKPIARGELVIVNDRYGVKVDEVIAGVHQSKPQISDTTVEEENPPQENSDTFDTNDSFEQENPSENQEAQNAEEDEFDYSDFELEDEDI